MLDSSLPNSCFDGINSKIKNRSKDEDLAHCIIGCIIRSKFNYTDDYDRI